MAERYEQVDGPPGSAIFNKWLTSGDFPNYDTNVTLVIKNVMLGHDLQVPGPNPVKEGLVAFFEPTRPGKPEKQLLLNKSHQRALKMMFGKTMASWRGSVDIFVTKLSIKVANELHDQVKIREREPVIKSNTPLNDEPNKGGGVGKLGEPKRGKYSPAKEVLKVMAIEVMDNEFPPEFPDDAPKKDSPALDAFKTMGKEVTAGESLGAEIRRVGREAGLEGDTVVEHRETRFSTREWDDPPKLPAEDPSLIPELCGKGYPHNFKDEAPPPCDMLPSHDGVCSWARDPATGDPFPPELV